MSTQIHIREALAGDNHDLGHVQLTSWKTMFPASQIQADDYLAQFSDEERAEAWAWVLLRDQRPVIYVAQVADQVVGFASSKKTEPETPYACELLAIHILPDYRAQGIGRKLIAATARHWHEQGCASLWLWTLKHNPARAVYEHLGGVLSGEKADQSSKNNVSIDIVEVAYGWSAIADLF